MAKDTTPETLPEGEELTPSGGDEAVNADAQPGLKDRLGEALGKEFKDDETALKAVKDTFSYVGKIGNLQKLEDAMSQLKETFKTDETGVITKLTQVASAPKEEVDPNNFVSRKEYEDELFYSNNPEYKDHRELISTFRNKQDNQGKSLDELLGENGDAVLKAALDSIRAGKEAKESKSVLQSNPRLGQVKDKLQEAASALEKGDHVAASNKAVESVIDSYDLAG